MYVEYFITVIRKATNIRLLAEFPGWEIQEGIEVETREGDLTRVEWRGSQSQVPDCCRVAANATKRGGGCPDQAMTTAHANVFREFVVHTMLTEGNAQLYSRK